MTSTPTIDEQEPEGSNSGFVRRMIDSHSVLGLAFAALIYIVSLSGALTLFMPEISLWENRNTVTSFETTPAAIAGAMENAEAELKPDNEILNIIAYAPDEFKPYLTVRLNERKDQKSELISTDWVADPKTGTLVSEAKSPYAHVIEDLHTMLHLPRPWGRYLVGLLGVVMFTLILSGIFAHPTIFRDAFKLRLKRNTRIAWTDVHNRLSVWGLPFHLIITFTGAFLGVAGITVAALAMLVYEGDQEAAIQVIQGPQAIEGAPPLSAPPDYKSMLERSRADGRTFSLLVANNPKDSGNTTTVAYYEEGILSMRTSDIYRNTGEWLAKFGGSGSPAGARAFGMVQPLHYGTFGGYPIKILYFVLSLALTYITSTGMMIWFKRKQQQGQPKPKSEAAWRGMTTGLSLGLAGTALLVAANISAPLEPVFFVLWGLSIATIYFAKDPTKMVCIQYLLTAAFLVLAALFHFPTALSSGPAAQGILIAINISLMVGALIFTWISLREIKVAASPQIEEAPAE